MKIIELERDDFDQNGYVILRKAVNAVLKATGHIKVARRLTPHWHPRPWLDNTERWPVLPQREIWNKVYAGVARRILNPVDPVTHAYRAKDDYADAVVPFPELVKFGRKTGLYNFKQAIDEPAAAPVEKANESNPWLVLDPKDPAPASEDIDAVAGAKQKQEAGKPPIRMNEQRAFLLACIDDNIPSNIASIWLHIRTNAGREDFLFKSAGKSSATTKDDKTVHKKNLARQLSALVKNDQATS